MSDPRIASPVPDTDPRPITSRQSLSWVAARNLATATVSAAQNAARTPRWLKRLLPWVDLDGGAYRVNRRKIILPPPGRVALRTEGGKIRVAPTSLACIPLFSEVDPGMLASLADHFEAKTFPPGAIVLDESTQARRLYLVADGKLELSVTGPHGDRLCHGLLGAGDYFGEQSFLEASIKFPQLRALSSTTLLSLDKSVVDALAKKEPTFRAALVEAIESRTNAAKWANEHGEKFVDLSTVEGSRQVGEPRIPTTFVDYDENPREYQLSAIQTVLQTHTRVTDLYSNRIDPLQEQIRITLEAIHEWEEWELINNPEFGLLKEVASAYRIPTRSGPPTPDDLDELISLVWKKPGFFLAHPKAIAAFGRECTRRGVVPATVEILGSPLMTWRGVPLVPTDKLLVDGHTHPTSRLGTTSILLLRVGAEDQGVIGLQKAAGPGDIEPGLSVRPMGINDQAIASHLVTRYFTLAVLTEDAVACLENVHVGHYADPA